MPIIVYGSNMSPPVRSVLLTAKILGLEAQFKFVNVYKGDTKTEAYLKMNPAHTIPVIDDNGFTLSESRAIMMYLVQKYGKDDKLYPKDLAKRALVDSRMYFDASMFFPSTLAYLAPLMFADAPPDAEKLAIMTDKIEIVNTMLGRSPYFAGDHLTIADLGLINSLTFPIVVDNFSLESYPNIKKWIAKVISELPFYEEVCKKGLDGLANYHKTKVLL